MIEIGPGIELGPGVTIGAVAVFASVFVTEIAQAFLVTEDDQQLIEE
jgi:hypothetical protein